LKRSLLKEGLPRLVGLGGLAWMVPICALGGEIPDNAYSRSLLIPPELLEHESLVFQYPQMAAGHESQVLAMANSGSSETGVGGILRSGSSRFFLLSQPVFSMTLSRGSFSSITREPLRLIQGGWALETDSARLGIAARASRLRERRDDKDFFPDDESRNRTSYSESRVNRWEASIGAGLRADHVLFDVAIEITREDLELGGLYLDRNDTLAINVDGRTDGGLGAAARLELPLGKATSIRFAGKFLDMSIRGDQRQWIQGEPISTSFRDYGHAWSAGVSVNIESERSHVWRWFGHYSNFRGGETLNTRSRADLDASLHEVDLVRVGLSLERPIRDEFILMAGVRSSYQRETIRVQDDSGTALRESRVENEDISEDFSWGLTRAYRDLLLTGAMSTTLELDNLFLSMDARLRF
jgi:hypothetical protein